MKKKCIYIRAYNFETMQGNKIYEENINNIYRKYYKEI